MIKGLSHDRIQIQQMTILLPYDYSIDNIKPGCSLNLSFQDGISARAMPYKMYAVEDYGMDFDIMKIDADEYFDGLVKRGEAITTFTRMDKERFCIYVETIMTRHEYLKVPECLRASMPKIDILEGEKLLGTYHTVEEAKEAIIRNGGRAFMRFPSLFDKKRTA